MSPLTPWSEVRRPDRDSVGAVIVTYHPDREIGDRVRGLVGQVHKILIVDNGSTDEELVPIRHLEAAGVATILLNARNLGLAAALNQALAWGEQQGLAWVATLDQDTTPGPNLVAAAARVFETNRSRVSAVIGAGWVSGPDQRRTCERPEGIEVSHVITSGALHSVAIWRELGGFREDFFIDYVDTEYCLRARAAGYLVTRCCVTTMQHAIGNPTRRHMVFRSVTPSNHSGSRRYFITRNRINVWRMYWRREPGYVTYDMRATVKELVKLILFEEDRRAKVRAIAAGVRDGLRAPKVPPLPNHRTS